MARSRRAAVPRLGALRHPQARAPHHAVQVRLPPRFRARFFQTDAAALAGDPAAAPGGDAAIDSRRARSRRRRRIGRETPRRRPRRRRRRREGRRGFRCCAWRENHRNATIGAPRTTNANATLTRTQFSPFPYTQAHAQLRPARAVGRGQQGERAVSAGHGARRRDRRGARAFERRRRARRRRATFDFEEGGVNGWNGRARSAARYGTRALCSALIRGARRDARDVASGRRRDLDSVLATVIHACVATTRQTNIEHRLVSLRVQRHSRYARQETGPTARVVRFVASRVAYRSDASRPAAKSANESSDVGGVHCCAAAGGT